MRSKLLAEATFRSMEVLLRRSDLIISGVRQPHRRLLASMLIRLVLNYVKNRLKPLVEKPMRYGKPGCIA